MSPRGKPRANQEATALMIRSLPFMAEHMWRTWRRGECPAELVALARAFHAAGQNAGPRYTSFEDLADRLEARDYAPPDPADIPY